MDSSADWEQAMAAILSTDRVLASDAVRRAYDCDAYSLEKSAPAVVVLPQSTDEVQQIVRWCLENHAPFTPRGAGTGLSGGAMPALGGIVISTKKMSSILDIDTENRMLHAQAGAVNLSISKRVAEFGLHFAPDPSSQSVSTIGGNIAENSGGPHTLKYGVTYPHILEVTMVDSAGEIRSIGSLVEGAPGPDLLGIVVGSEGTLGIVTEAWVRLTPLPTSVSTMLASFGSVREATEAVAAIVASGVIPAALEMMDRGIIAALKAAFGLGYPDGSDALLLIECDGEESAVVEETKKVQDVCRANGAISVEIAKNEMERQKLWTARKRGIGAMGRLAPTIVTHDGVIPRSKLPEMLDFVYKVAAKHNIGVANLFHAGDGNLHPCLYFDDRDPIQVESAIATGEEIIRRCIELGGSISGEHGVGVEKLDLMKIMFTERDLHLQMLCREIFDVGVLCNPCKVIPDQKGCIEHRRRWKGAAT